MTDEDTVEQRVLTASGKDIGARASLALKPEAPYLQVWTLGWEYRRERAIRKGTKDGEENGRRYVQ